MISAPINYYPNRMGRIVLQAMEEILGHIGVYAVLNLAHFSDLIDQNPATNLDLKFPFEHFSRLQTAFERAYGPRAGRGLSLRVGRACLKYGLREFGPELGMTDLAFRLLPLPARLKVGSEALAELFNQFTDQHVNLEVDKKQLYWHIERRPLWRERQADGPCCTLVVGLLQEALSWFSRGKTFLVEEKNSNAGEDRLCTIVIDKTPIS